MVILRPLKFIFKQVIINTNCLLHMTSLDAKDTNFFLSFCVPTKRESNHLVELNYLR